MVQSRCGTLDMVIYCWFITSCFSLCARYFFVRLSVCAMNHAKMHFNVPVCVLYQSYTQCIHAGKTMLTLTNHKKSVRAMAPHPKEYVFNISWLLLVEWLTMVWFFLFIFYSFISFCLLSLTPSSLLSAGKLLHLPRLIILKSSPFQKENFVTICCEFINFLSNLCD